MTRARARNFSASSAERRSRQGLAQVFINAVASLEAGGSGFAQANNPKGCHSLCDHSKRGRSSPRKVEIAACHEGASIIDAHNHRAARGGIGHMQPRAEWEGSAGGRKTMLIERLSRRCPASG